MRPRLVEYLDSDLGLSWAEYLVPTGSTLLIAAIAVVLWVMWIRGPTAGLPRSHIVRASLIGVACGLVGSRIFHLLQHLDATLSSPGILLNFSGGTTSWGGYLFGTAGFCLYLVAKRQPLLPYLDLLAGSLGIGPAISRIGCFLNGCCFGAESSLPWAVSYPPHSAPWREHLAAGSIGADASVSLAVHPFQLYAAVLDLGIFFVLSRFWRRHHDRPGATFALYWLIYCALRFVNEFSRGDATRHGWPQLTLAQLICLGGALAAAYGLIRWTAQNTKPSPRVMGMK